MDTKKTIFLFFMCLFVFGQVRGQIGVRIGGHSLDVVSPSEIFLDGQSINFLDSPLGFQAGLFGKLDLKLITLETRLMFHSTSVNYTLNGDNGTIGSNIRSESFNNLDIPLLIGIDVLFLNLFAGPVAHIHLDATSELIELQQLSARFSAAEYGWRAGFGVNVGKLDLTLEYEGNFSRFGDHIFIAGRQFDFGTSPSRLLLSLGIEIL